MSELLSADFDPKQNRVVCAACLSKCGKHMVLGVRHWDSIMRATADMMKGFADINWVCGDQGFIDRNRNYLTREQAWKVAKEAGQILRIVDAEGRLYSENLY